MLESAKKGSADLIRAWSTYLPEAENMAIPTIFEVTVREGHVRLLQWLYDKRKLRVKK